MNREYFLIILSISLSLVNSLHSGFNFKTILVPLVNPMLSAVLTSYSPLPSEIQRTPSPVADFDSTSTESATMNVE